MAADLIQHSNIAHTFVHDLELAFWVLLWLAFSCRPNSWSAEDRSSFLNETMSPRVYHSSGGRSKLFFIQSEHSMSDFSVTNNEVLTDLLKNLKFVLAVRHLPRPSKLQSTSNLNPLAIKAKSQGRETLKPSTQDTKLLDKQIKDYDDLRDCLRDHTVIIDMIQMSLGSPRWPKDDAADPQDFLRCNEVLASMRSGSKRSRSVAEANGFFLRPPVPKRSVST